MASPTPPCDDVKTAVMGYPAPPPPPSKGHGQQDHTSKSAHSPRPCQPRASISNQPPPLESSVLVDCCVLWAVCIVALTLTTIFTIWFAGPDYPTLKVAGLTVSNLSVASSTGATWEAFVLVETPGFGGESSFHRIECFVYYHGDAAKPLALGLAESFMVRDGDRVVIKAKMLMERSEEAVVEDIDRERRSVGTVAVGLGLRMQGSYVLWLRKRGYGHVEAYCDNLRVVFAGSTGEGSLVTGDDLPSFFYKGISTLRLP